MVQPFSPDRSGGHCRRVSSVPVREELLDPIPESKRKRVPVTVDVPAKTSVKYVDNEHVVSRLIVENVIEIPEIRYRDIPVSRVEYQDKLVERIVEKKVPEVIIREELRDVPGEIIEVEKRVTTERKVPVSNYCTEPVPVVVSQSIRPVITESAEVVEVDVYEYEPQFVPVDVHVAKPVPTRLIPGNTTHEYHEIQMPPAQYNSILKALNPNADQKLLDVLPFISDAEGTAFLSENEMREMILVPEGVPIYNAENPAKPSHQPSQFKHQASHFKHQPSQFKHEPSLFKHQPSQFKHEPSLFKHQASQFKHEPSQFKHQASQFKHQASQFKHQASQFKHQASQFKHQASQFNVKPEDFNLHEASQFKTRDVKGKTALYKNDLYARPKRCCGCSC